MRKLFWACILCLFGIAGLPQAIPAADTIVYGPQIFKVGKGGILNTSTSFPSTQPGTSAILQVVNGDARGAKKVASGTITFNGVQAITPAELNSTATTIKKAITLNATNQLQVSLSDVSGDYITITVYISDADMPPPTATLSASPSMITSGSSSTLTWTTTNATAASISPDVGTVTTNGSVAVSPTITTTYTLTATGSGGTASATATVNVQSGQPPPSTVFGPTTYKIGKNGTLNATSNFASPAGSGTVTVSNGDGSGGKKVTSGTLTLNGVQIVGPTELNSGTTTLEKTAALQANNVLNVSLSGAFNSYVVVTVKHYPAETTAPSITSFTIPATHNSFSVPITAFSATDNIGVTGYLVRESTATPTASDPGWLAAPPASFTVTAEGSHTLSAWAKDAAGNVSARAVATVVVTLPDTLSPTILTFVVPVTHNSLVVPITAFNAIDNVGVAGYLVGESTATPTANDPGWLTAPPASFTLAADGAHTLTAWAKDAAGNVSTGAFAEVYVDTGVPTVELFEVQPLVHVFAIPVQSFVAVDDTAVTGYLITEASQVPLAGDPRWSAAPPSSFTVSAEGVHTLYAWVRDTTGNISASASAMATIVLQDIVPPVVSRFVLPATHASLDVPVQDFAATDDVGVAAYLVTASAATPTLDDPGWTTTPQTHYVVASEGAQTIYAWVKDAAANLSVGVPATVTVTLADTAPPTVQQFDLPASHDTLVVPILALAATDNKAVTALLLTETAVVPAADDPRWQATPPATFGFSAAGSHTLYAWARDAAGNVSAGVSDTVTITLSDTVRPTIDVFTIPGTHDALTVPILSLTASDNVAVTGYLVTASATAPRPDAAGWRNSPPVSHSVAANGPYTLYVWAKDAAGNVSLGASAQVEVTVSTAASTQIHYYYDTLGQLSRVVGDTVGNIYQYDEVGNLLTVATSNTSVAPPVIDSVIPNVLLVGNEQLVKISGRNLLSTNSVTSGSPGLVVGQYTLSDTELQVHLSATSAGAATLRISTVYGTVDISLTCLDSTLRILPGQLALLPGQTGAMTVEMIPAPNETITFNIINNNVSMVEAPGTVTISTDGTGSFPVKGLAHGSSHLTVAGVNAVVFVADIFNSEIKRFKSNSVSVYVDKGLGATSLVASPISIYLDPLYFDGKTAVSKPVSVFIDTSTTAPSTLASKPVSVFIEASTTPQSSLASSPVSVFIETSATWPGTLASRPLSIFVNPPINISVPALSNPVSVSLTQ